MKPITLTAREVCGIIDGSITQIRRDVKPQPGMHESDEGYGVMHRCPYSPGNVLWCRETFDSYIGEKEISLVYKADSGSKPFGKNKWRSPQCMKPWASRLSLEVVSVRVQRVQDVTEEDAIAMGFENGSDYPMCIGDCMTAYGRYLCAIDSERPGTWRANPWQFVYDVRVVK